MRKKVFGKKFKRDSNERKSLFKGLMSALILMESIQTTHHKAQAIQGQIEKIVTKTNKKGRAVKKDIRVYLTDEAIEKMITDIAPRFTSRPGGYTRIIRAQRRLSDKADMSIIEWVEGPSKKVSKVSEVPEVSKGEEKVKKIKKVQKKEEVVKPKKAQKKK